MNPLEVNLHDGWAKNGKQKSEDKDSGQGDDNENWPERMYGKDTEEEELP